MNIHDKSKKEWYDAFCSMAKENALLAAKVRIGEKGRIENLKATVKDQQETIERLLVGIGVLEQMNWAPGEACDRCCNGDPI